MICPVTTMRCNMYCIVLQCIALHCIALHCIAVHSYVHACIHLYIHPQSFWAKPYRRHCFTSWCVGCLPRPKSKAKKTAGAKANANAKCTRHTVIEFYANLLCAQVSMGPIHMHMLHSSCSKSSAPHLAFASARLMALRRLVAGRALDFEQEL